MKLLIIDDDKHIVATLEEELSKNYIVETCFTGEEGEYLAEVNEYDLIILDLGLPDVNGSDVCRRLRENSISTPILILTGDAETASKISLLNLGADDYLTKPFNIGELRARIKALLRRTDKSLSANILAIGNLTLDLDKKTVRRGSKTISLRRKEFYILEYLIRNADNVVSRNMILSHVWDSNFESLTNVVDVHIKYLRDSLDKSFSKKFIKTVHGLGYKIEV